MEREGRMDVHFKGRLSEFRVVFPLGRGGMVMLIRGSLLVRLGLLAVTFFLDGWNGLFRPGRTRRVD